ncbi:MAG: hypothetical protein IJ680_01210, partial [Paludibacteraceae bacterium]|nr:hypothetical protein [Paludibacteraceae bacterium]
MKKHFTRWLAIMAATFVTASSVWAQTGVHMPGKYDDLPENGGYGITLTEMDDMYYEVYYQSKASLNTAAQAVQTIADAQQYRIIAADTKKEATVLSSSNANNSGYTFSGQDWLLFTGKSGNGLSMSNFDIPATANGEFYRISPTAGLTRQLTDFKFQEGISLKIKVKGYSQFSILGADNSNNGQNPSNTNKRNFIITIDGVDVTRASEVNNTETIRRYDIDINTEHTIEIGAVGASNSRLMGFSLAYPAEIEQPDEPIDPVIKQKISTAKVGDVIDLTEAFTSTNTKVALTFSGDDVVGTTFTPTTGKDYTITVSQAAVEDWFNAYSDTYTITVSENVSYVIPTSVLTLPNITNDFAGKVTPGYYAEAGDWYVFNAFELYQSKSKQTWTDYTASGSGSATVSSPEAPFKGSNAWTKASGVDNITATMNTKDNRKYYYQVTNVEEVRALIKSGSTSRTVSMNVYESGRAAVVKTASDKTNNDVVLKLDGLDPTKTYVVELCNDNTSNSNLYEIAFKAPSKPKLTGAWSASEATVYVGDEVTAPTFSVTADNDAVLNGTEYTVTYSLKAGSDDIITIAGDSKSFTLNNSAAGTATLVATLTSTNEEAYVVETATYEFAYTVKAKTPVLELNETEGTIALGRMQTEGSVTFTLTGAFLTGATGITGLAAGMTLSPDAFSLTDGAVEQEFTLTYSSSDEASGTATIT